MLNNKDVKALINECKFSVENAYRHKLEENFGGDEYFKRGFLLACNELTSIFLNVLNAYEIKKKVS